MENRKGEDMKVAPGNGHIIRMPLDGTGLNEADLEYALLMRDLK
jgi:putative protease